MSHKQLAANFSFSRDDAADGTSDRLFSAIAYQLALNLPEIRPRIENIIEANPSILQGSMDIQLQRLVLDPLSSIKEPLPMVIIIDGLDECGSADDQRQVIQLISRALYPSFPLCILISSRPEPIISEAFHQHLQTTSTHLALDESVHPDEDIKVFLEDCLKNIYNKRQKSMLFDKVFWPWSGPEELRVLVEKSSGNFLNAANILKAIDEGHVHSNSQLETVLNETVDHNAFSTLESPHSGIKASPRQEPLHKRGQVDRSKADSKDKRSNARLEAIPSEPTLPGISLDINDHSHRALEALRSLEADEGGRYSINTSHSVAGTCARFLDIFQDSERYRRFLSYRGKDAQALLNLIQAVCCSTHTTPSYIDRLFYSCLMALISRRDIDRPSSLHCLAYPKSLG